MRLLRPVTLPGLPSIPGGLALLALRQPRLLPPLLRWRAASQGLGLVVARLASAEQEKLSAVLHEIGQDQGRAVRQQLGYGRNPTECARVVALANSLYNIKARVVAGSAEARVVTRGCPWSEHRWWGPLPCGVFSRYEMGLVQGLNPAVRLRYESKRTRGDDRCIGVYGWKGQPS